MNGRTLVSARRTALLMVFGTHLLTIQQVLHLSSHLFTTKSLHQFLTFELAGDAQNTGAHFFEQRGGESGTARGNLGVRVAISLSSQLVAVLGAKPGETVAQNIWREPGGGAYPPP